MSLPQPDERPSWLLDPTVTLQEAADLIGVPEDTTKSWLRTAELMGLPIGTKLNSRHRLTPHAVFVLTILSALRLEGIPVTSGLLASARQATMVNGMPSIPRPFQQVRLNEPCAGNRPSALIIVDIGAIWTAIKPKLTALLQPAK